MTICKYFNQCLDSDSSKTLPNPGTSISTGAGSIMEGDVLIGVHTEPLSSRAMAEESNTQEICDKEEEFADPRASLDINDSKREAEGSVRNASELVQRAAQTAFSRSKRGEGDKERQPATEIMMNTGNDTHSVTQGAEKDNGEIKVRVSLKIDCCPVEKAEQKEGHLTAVNPDAIPDNLPTKVLAAIADRYLKYLKPTNREGFSEFLQYLIDVRKVIIVGLDFGSLIITVECRSLKILDELWKDYRTGYLAKMAQQYLVTDYILKKFELVDVKLTTTFDEENYRVARERALLLQSAGHVTVKKVLTAGALSVENKKESMTTEVFPSTDADTPNRTAQRARGSRKRGKAPENQDQKGIKKLHSAAKNGDVAAIDSLLLLGIGIDARDESGRTPLVTAILNGQLQAIKYLIGNGADPLKRSHGWNSLHWASFFGHTDVIEFLIRHVPDIDSRADQDMTPVLIATRYGKLQTVEFLISKGANLDLRDDRGWSSLHWASDINRTDIIELLVSHMTDTDPRDTKDRTPLMRAAWYGKLQAVECLIGLGANPSLEDDDGWNSLHWALLSDNTAVIDTMLSHGVSAESKTKKGDTPLMLARRYGVPNAITYLLRKSAKSD
ncbi:ankyrin-3-like isoform X3 [Stylophora pistillata]|uniref:ankyrin-3-like isoform X3 n=1 Tax=Stylophora pistillata TaxID=50429 RepID=UPI000C0466FE|nr:ankyrin-3-like isoform X3 [Stylophora pistillata]